MRARVGAALAVAALLVGCASKKPRPFPALPTTPEAVAALVARETVRPPPAEAELDAAGILAAAEARGLGTLPAGEEGVLRWIQAALDRAPGDALVVLGTYHDSAGQIDAFRRLVGPGGLRGLDLVAVEQLRADGAWQGAPAAAQQGDGAALEAWTARGDREAFAALARSHRDGDYAAWKFGYEASVLDLLVNARATGVRLVGCDMPTALQGLAGLTSGDARNRLRELHCLYSLPAPKRRVAMLWGQAHVRRGGLPRFVAAPAVVLSIYAFGQRPGGGEVEAALGKGLAVNDAVLVPLGPDEAALLLPDEVIGGRVDRVLATEDAVVAGVEARSEVEGVLTMGGRSVPVGREAASLALPAGEHTYAFTGGGMRVVGSLRLAAGHRVELGFDPKARVTSYVERAPR